MPPREMFIRAASAGLGAVVAGPLGAAFGGLLAHSLGPAAASLIQDSAQAFGEKSGEKLLDLGTDSVLGAARSCAPHVEAVYCEALRKSLKQIFEKHRYDNFDDWFDNWDRCLSRTDPMDLPTLDPDELAPEQLDNLLRRTLERLDAQGAAISRAPSIVIDVRPIPDALIVRLAAELPDIFKAEFDALIRTPRYAQASKDLSLAIERVNRSRILSIHQLTEKIWEKIGNGSKEKDDEFARLTQTLVQLTTRMRSQGNARLRQLVDSGDLDGALALLIRGARRRGRSKKAEKDFFVTLEGWGDSLRDLLPNVEEWRDTLGDLLPNWPATPSRGKRATKRRRPLNPKARQSLQQPPATNEPTPIK